MSSYSPETRDECGRRGPRGERGAVDGIRQPPHRLVDPLSRVPVGRPAGFGELPGRHRRPGGGRAGQRSGGAAAATGSWSTTSDCSYSSHTADSRVVRRGDAAAGGRRSGCLRRLPPARLRLRRSRRPGPGSRRQRWVPSTAPGSGSRTRQGSAGGSPQGLPSPPKTLPESAARSNCGADWVCAGARQYPALCPRPSLKAMSP